MERTENCGTCRFWAEDQGSYQRGVCRKRAPELLVLGQQIPTAAFPPMHFSGWCGEHKRPDPPPAG